MADVIVTFQTDDYRGDHAADIELSRTYPEDTPLSVIVADAVKHKSSADYRATIVIRPIGKEQRHGE